MPRKASDGPGFIVESATFGAVNPTEKNGKIRTKSWHNAC
jgi:hypothetical protein